LDSQLEEENQSYSAVLSTNNQVLTRRSVNWKANLKTGAIHSMVLSIIQRLYRKIYLPTTQEKGTSGRVKSRSGRLALSSTAMPTMTRLTRQWYYGHPFKLSLPQPPHSSGTPFKWITF
jgi:hypothetical protein